MASSSPTHSRRQREEVARAGSTGNRTPGPLNATVQFPPTDALRLYTSTEARDFNSLKSFARQIAGVHTRATIPTSQASSFDVLPRSRRAFPAEADGRTPRCSRNTSPPNRESPRRASRSSTPACSPRANEVVDPIGIGFVQTMAQFADRMSAQLAAQSAAEICALRDYVALRRYAERALSTADGVACRRALAMPNKCTRSEHTR